MELDTQFRDAHYLEDGRIDCEILHPIFGWVPFTANPNDPELHGRVLFEGIKSSGKVKPYEVNNG